MSRVEMLRSGDVVRRYADGSVELVRPVIYGRDWEESMVYSKYDSAPREAAMLQQQDQAAAMLKQQDQEQTLEQLLGGTVDRLQAIHGVLDLLEHGPVNEPGKAEHYPSGVFDSAHQAEKMAGLVLGRLQVIQQRIGHL